MTKTEVLKYAKDSITANLTKLTKQLKSCEKMKDKKKILEQLISQKQGNNTHLFLNNETKEFIFLQLDKEMKTVEETIKKVETLKKEIEFLNNLNNQIK